MVAKPFVVAGEKLQWNLSTSAATWPDGHQWANVPTTHGPVFVPDAPDATQIHGMPAFPYRGMDIGLP